MDASVGDDLERGADAQARLKALAAYDILDTPAEAGFDDIAFIASQVCSTPVALVSLVDRERQWFKARVGLEACETPISQSVCAHALNQTDLLVIPDLTTDPRTRDNPLVTRSPRIRFYAGAPLVTPEGVAIGTLCVIDMIPRSGGLTADQVRTLESLARQVMAQLELRRAIRAESARAAIRERENAALRSVEEFAKNAQEAGGVGTFELDVATNVMMVSPEFCRLFGMPVAATYPAKAFEDLVIPDDAGVRSDVASRADGTATPYVEYRIRRADDRRLRWLARRARFTLNEAGHPQKMSGVVHDVSDRRKLQEHQAALLDLGDRLRIAASARDVAATSTEIVGRVLGATRAGYVRIGSPDGTFEIEGHWTGQGGPSPEADSFRRPGRQAMDRLARGETVAVANRASADWLGDAAARAEGGSEVMIPLIERGDLIGLLFIHRREARAWSESDLNFLHGVADRTHAGLAKVRAEAEQRTLNAELSHRLKNTLAMVQAIAGQTLRAVSDREAVAALEKRIHALSVAHDVLVHRNWSEARLREVVAASLQTFDLGGRIEVAGPDIRLSASAALGLSLILHELATNALKYGALSNDCGRVSLLWQIAEPDTKPTLQLAWRESGGPPVQEPARRGFGSRLIQLGLAGTGGVALRYPPDGFQADFDASLRHLMP